jgi:inosose dehydratase
MMDRAPDRRASLRRPGDALASSSIGAVPILWNNVDVADLRPPTEAATVLDEIARTGYEGCQLGAGFPSGGALRGALEDRGLRLAEVYAGLPSTADGPTADASAIAFARLAELQEAGGDVLVVALDVETSRSARAGRAEQSGTPGLSDAGWEALGGLLHQLAGDARAGGHVVAFHPHAGTFVETSAEVDRLLAMTDPALVGLCLDVGHCLVGGGDPAATIQRHGTRIRHVHLKDVDPDILTDLRMGTIRDFRAAIRARLFTELGAGILDLDSCLEGLARLGYDGWLMVEQDSTWLPPSEAAAIGRRVLARELRRLGRRGGH